MINCEISPNCLLSEAPDPRMARQVSIIGLEYGPGTEAPSLTCKTEFSGFHIKCGNFLIICHEGNITPVCIPLLAQLNCLAIDFVCLFSISPLWCSQNQLHFPLLLDHLDPSCLTATFIINSDSVPITTFSACGVVVAPGYFWLQCTVHPVFVSVSPAHTKQSSALQHGDCLGQPPALA